MNYQHADPYGLCFRLFEVSWALALIGAGHSKSYRLDDQTLYTD